MHSAATLTVRLFLIFLILLLFVSSLNATSSSPAGDGDSSSSTKAIPIVKANASGSPADTCTGGHVPLVGGTLDNGSAGYCFQAASPRAGSLHKVTPLEEANWLKASSLLEPVFWPLKDTIATALRNICSNVEDISDHCRLSLEQFTYFLSRGESVSYRMMDSFGSFGHSLFTQGISSLGDYSQCVNIRFNKSFARYTMIQIHMPLPEDMDIMSLSRPSQLDITDGWKYQYSTRIGALRYIPQIVSVCLPSQCSRADIESVLDSPYFHSALAPIRLSVFSSETKAEPYFQANLITTLARLTVLSVIIFTAIATFVIRTRATRGTSTLAAFDAVENSYKLLAEPVCDERLHFFSGYKAIYLFFCTIGHATVPLTKPIMIEGIYPYVYISNDFFSQIFSNATGFVITTNFVVTACLSMIAILPEVKRRKGKISIVSLVLVRALRTLPTICAYIILVMSLPWLTTSNEPLVNPVQKDIIRRCSSNWWRELLFISNTIDILDTCHQFAWFISADMQIAILSSASILLFYRRPLASLALIALQLVASMALQYSYLEWKGITPKLLIFSLDANSIWTGFRDIYVKSITYIPSYTIGLVVGILIANSVTVKSDRTVKYLMLWSVATCFAVTASPSFLYTDKYFNLPLKYESLYAVLSCATHSLTIGTFIYCVYHFPQNVVVKFFSSKPFVIVSRLTFSAFIVQPLILLFNRKNRYSLLYQFQDGVFNYVACLFFGYLMYITIEAPFYNLTKFIFKPTPKSGCRSNCSSSSPGKADGDVNNN